MDGAAGMHDIQCPCAACMLQGVYAPARRSSTWVVQLASELLACQRDLYSAMASSEVGCIVTWTDRSFDKRDTS